MEDEIDITRRAVGQVMWKYFHILNSWAYSWAHGGPVAGKPFRRHMEAVMRVWKTTISSVIVWLAIVSLSAAQDVGGMYTFFGLADWDRDGHQDIVARENATGHLWLYPSESKRRYSSAQRVQIGNGW